tara:strand:+ start:9814 stop:9954 length:141 start_codon:yes stop_codon:yes gene_type:complete
LIWDSVKIVGIIAIVLMEAVVLVAVATIVNTRKKKHLYPMVGKIYN